MNFYLNSLTRKVKRCFSVIMLVNFEALIDNSSKKDKFIDHFIIVNKF